MQLFLLLPSWLLYVLILQLAGPIRGLLSSGALPGCLLSERTVFLANAMANKIMNINNINIKAPPIVSPSNCGYVAAGGDILKM